MIGDLERAATLAAATLTRQSYGIATAGNAFGGARGIWLECSRCPVSHVIVGSAIEPWPHISTADAATVFTRHGWTGQGEALKQALCPRCSTLGRWPADVTVPAPPMRGRVVTPPPGHEEGEFCLRIDGRGETCLGTIEYLPDEDFGGCGCHAMRHPPCSYCTSTMPECDRCGYREEG